jgi:hypothetical protein
MFWKTILVLILFVVTTTLDAQEILRRTCAYDSIKKSLMANDPEFAKIREQIEKDYQNYLLNEDKTERATFTIPIVVHVVYRTNQENISDAQIQSQIDVLNEDFRRLNSDASNTPAVFQGVAADADIEFCLASRDPDGNPTNGITRTQTTEISFGLNHAMKSNNTGGKSPWPRTSYLNIWVCNLGSGLLGYATPPGSPASIDGVVIRYQSFGRIGAALAPFNRGRTATHEVGHWLSLLHIWGDDDGACTGSDLVADTPNQADAYYLCPSYPQSSCGSEDMFMNYMDYVNDGCMNLFTVGQRARMQAVLNVQRLSLKNSLGCTFVNPGGGGCDTLMNRALSAYTFLYGAGQGVTGYLAGHNSYLNRSKAERFSSLPASKQITGARLRFGMAKFANANSKITVKAWASNNGLPGNVLAEKDVFINQINTNGFTNVNFDSPIMIFDSLVFIGFEMTYASEDTVALLASDLLAASANNFAFEQFENGSWHAFNQNPPSWGFSTSLAIQAVLCSPLGDEKIVLSKNVIDVFPNPSQGDVQLSYYMEKKPENLQVNVFNINGQLQAKAQFRAEGSGTFALDLQKLNNGVYIIEIRGVETHIRKKIIISK